MRVQLRLMSTRSFRICRRVDQAVRKTFPMQPSHYTWFSSRRKLQLAPRTPRFYVECENAKQVDLYLDRLHRSIILNSGLLSVSCRQFQALHWIPIRRILLVFI
jgi:hypothetical protein